MRRFFGIVLCFVLIGAICSVSFSAEEKLCYTPEQIANFEKDGLFTVVPKEIIEKLSLKFDYLYGILHSAKEKDNSKLLQFYLTSATDVPYGWDKSPYEILQGHIEEQKENDYQHYFYYAMSQTQVGIFSFTHKNGTLRANTYPTGTGANPAGIGSLSGSLLDRELLSIDVYMVFENQICKVQNVMIFCDTNDLNSYIYYMTDKGNYVKYFTTVWEKSVGQKESPPLWFSVEEFNTVLETLYKEDRITWLEETRDQNSQAIIGGIPLNVLSDMEKAGMEIPYCEAGNPIPAHLQAEINSLRGVVDTVPSQDSEQTDVSDTTDSVDTTSSDGTVTDTFSDETITNTQTEESMDTTITEEAVVPILPDGLSDNIPSAPAPFPWLWVIVSAGAVLIIAATAILFIRKKKTQK